jgi:dihydrofolate reductase
LRRIDMSKVVSGMTVSLDGFITGPNDRPRAGLGDGGERLHYWVFGGPWTYEGPRGVPAGVDRAYLQEVFSNGGAMICGRTMHDVVNGWGETPGFGMPIFVVTHRPHPAVVKGDTSFQFVTGGIAEALLLARTAAGDKDVIIMGGGELLRQCLAAGLIEAFTLTIAPVLLGSGKRLFDGLEGIDVDFDREAVIESPYATHLRFRIRRGPVPDGVD